MCSCQKPVSACLVWENNQTKLHENSANVHKTNYKPYCTENRSDKLIGLFRRESSWTPFIVYRIKCLRVTEASLTHPFARINIPNSYKSCSLAQCTRRFCGFDQEATMFLWTEHIRRCDGVGVATFHETKVELFGFETLVFALDKPHVIIPTNTPTVSSSRDHDVKKRGWSYVSLMKLDLDCQRKTARVAVRRAQLDTLFD